MADERDFLAAKLNAEGGKGDEGADAKNANYTEAFDAPEKQGPMGPGKEPQNRAGTGEGNRAPLAQDTGGEAQYSVFDGKGNEQVVVHTTNEQGQPAEGTGYDAETARAEATDGEVQTGSGFGHPDRD